MPRSSGAEQFVLEEGVEITMPSNVSYYSAENQGENEGKTPNIVYLEQVGRENPKFFIHDGTVKANSVDSKKVLFVPDGLNEGDKVVVKWVDPKCACAERAA